MFFGMHAFFYILQSFSPTIPKEALIEWGVCALVMNPLFPNAFASSTTLKNE